MADLHVKDIPDPLHDRLRRHAQAQNSTISAVVLIADAEKATPELMDAEVLSVLRQPVLSGELEQTRAETPLDDLVHWPIDRVSHRELTQLAWLHDRNISAYDALYGAAARSGAMPWSPPTGGCPEQPTWESR